MRVTTYCYPWDLARLGVERMLGQVAEAGIDAIDVAAAYHPIDSLSPRDGLRLYSSPRGAVHFPARAELYSRIKPQLAAPEILATWPDIARQADRLGLALNAWTITLYQPWIRDAYPETARVLPSGDRSGAGVCPANPDVQAFLVALCGDVVEQFGIDLVRLETVMPIHDFDWLRPRVLIAIPPLARALLNLCFCATCTGRAKARGVDAARLQSRIMAIINAEIAGTDGAEDRAAAVQADAEIARYTADYVGASTDLLRAIATRIAGRARTSVNTSVSYAPVVGDAANDALMGAFVDAADQVALHPGNAEVNRQLARLANRPDRRRELSELVPRFRMARPGAPANPVAGGPTGTTAGAPAESPEIAVMKAAAEQGVREVSLYHFTLLREADVRAFMGDVRGLFPRTARGEGQCACA